MKKDNYDNSKEIKKYIILLIIISILVFGGLITVITGLFFWSKDVIAFGTLGFLLGCFIMIEFDNANDEIAMEMDKYEPFDVVIYKPTGERGLVKRVTEDGVFVLFRIQSTAQLCKFEDIELE